MKKYKVEAIMKFTDKEENIKRNVGDIFEITETRYNFLKSNNAVRLIEILQKEKDEITEQEVQAVAVALVEQAEEDNKSVEEIVDEIIEESKEKVIEKPKKKKSSKK